MNSKAHPKEDDKVSTKPLTPLSILLWADSDYDLEKQNLEFPHSTVSLADDLQYSLGYKR